MNDQQLADTPRKGGARLRGHVLRARQDVAVSGPPRQFRQGDVLLAHVAACPDDNAPTPVSGGSTVLALGELTGHAHVLSVAEGELLEAETAGERFVSLSGEGSLTHEEHGAIVVPAGTYQVVRQREYRPRPSLPSRSAWVVD